jgi:Ankyrin repeat
MSDDAVSPGTPQEVALQTILRSIAVRDRSTAARLLAGSPALARQALDVGATRAEESPYYFEELARFVYAGDTPLHIAAAAYETDIAEELVSRGAHVRARNRRGPNRFTTRWMGLRGQIPGIQRRNMPLSSS